MTTSTDFYAHAHLLKGGCIFIRNVNEKDGYPEPESSFGGWKHLRFKGFYNDGIELFYSAEGPKETNVTARIPYESVKRVEWGGHDAFTDDPNAPHIFCTFNQMNGPYDFHLD